MVLVVVIFVVVIIIIIIITFAICITKLRKEQNLICFHLLVLLLSLRVLLLLLLQLCLYLCLCVVVVFLCSENTIDPHRRSAKTLKTDTNTSSPGRLPVYASRQKSVWKRKSWCQGDSQSLQRHPQPASQPEFTPRHSSQSDWRESSVCVALADWTGR